MDESDLKERNSDMQILALAMLPVCKLLVAVTTQDVVQHGQRSLPELRAPPEVAAGFRPPSLPYFPEHFCFTLYKESE